MTIDAIKQDLNKKSLVAVNYIVVTMHTFLIQAVDSYYGGYTPKRYKRTGKMKTTPKIMDAGHQIGNGAEGQFKLDLSPTYSTGTWSMGQVIDSAEAYLHGGYSLGTGVSVWRSPMQSYPFVEAAGRANAVLYYSFVLRITR